MKARKLFMLALICFSILVSLQYGVAREEFLPYQTKEPLIEKVYLSSDRIFIYPEGIFYLDELGEVVPARFVASDGSGLYIFADRIYQCPCCNRGNRDNKCNNPNCPLYGK